MFILNRYYIAAPWLGLLKNGVWLKNASHANGCAAMLEEKLRNIPEVDILFPRQANAVFARMDELVIEKLHRRGWRFYTFIGTGGARLMCSWDTSEKTIRAFVDDLKAAIAAGDG